MNDVNAKDKIILRLLDVINVLEGELEDSKDTNKNLEEDLEVSDDLLADTNREVSEGYIHISKTEETLLGSQQIIKELSAELAEAKRKTEAAHYALKFVQKKRGELENEINSLNNLLDTVSDEEGHF